jgi:hypothetical protein
VAKHTVDHTCGHSQTHQLYGPHKERERKLAWLEGTPCSECYRARKDTERASANAAAAEQNQLAALPALTGSERQIAWAESIRKPICAALSEVESSIEVPEWLSPEAKEEFGDALVLLVDEVRSRSSAKWWIEDGQQLDIRNKGRAFLYLAEQIRERKLAPTTEREVAEADERKKREIEEKRRVQAELIASLIADFRTDDLTWDPADDVTSGAIAGHAIRYSGSGIYGEVAVDGETLLNPGTLRGRILDFRNAQQSLHYQAERLKRCDSLKGLAVAEVKKLKQDLTVTLSDGRQLVGKSSREGWSLDFLRPGSYLSVDPDHPEVCRLTVEAKAWAKSKGVK